MSRGLLTLIAPAAMAGVAAWWASPAPALVDAGGGTSAVFSGLAAAAIVALGVAPLALRGRTRRPAWLTLATVALVAGLALFFASGSVERACTARYDGRPLVIGTVLTPSAAAYARENPELSNGDLLFDAAGAADRVWTPASISRCRLALGATHALWIPFLVLSIAGVWHALTSTSLTAIVPRATAIGAGARAATASTPRYDVFLSYRHGGADGDIARQLLHALEARGLRVAIDERDFPANESFLLEMERCVRESRFTVAVISARYLESDNCQEEAIICKVLDMGERKRRLIPVITEHVAMPTWLYGIVGIDLTTSDPLVDPIEKLVATLRPSRDSLPL